MLLTWARIVETDPEGQRGGDRQVRLTRFEKDILGQPRINLVKVVCIGTSPTNLTLAPPGKSRGPDSVQAPKPVDDKRGNAWIRLAIISAIAQEGAEIQGFAKTRLVMDPAKPGYSWVIIPVGIA